MVVAADAAAGRRDRHPRAARRAGGLRRGDPQGQRHRPAGHRPAQDRRRPGGHRDQPGHRRGDPGVGHRLRAGRLRHRRRDGRARARPARLEFAQGLRPAACAASSTPGEDEPARDRRRDHRGRRRTSARGSAGRPARQGRRHPTIIERLEADGTGAGTVNFRLRDWLLSRQRYWGAPIPIIHCAACGEVAGALGPAAASSCRSCAAPTSSPRAPRRWAAADRVGERRPARPAAGRRKRDTDTMDTFVDSSWYFLRYCSPHDDTQAFDPRRSQRVEARATSTSAASSTRCCTCSTRGSSPRCCATWG